MRAAIIGLGPMGRRHVAALAQVHDAELVAVCDTRADALAWEGLPPSIERFSDSGMLFDTSKPELVIVATTASSHSTLVAQAVTAGARAILCEKPISCSLSSARAMIEGCQKAGVRIAVNHCRRHVPAYAWLRDRIISGEWGVPRGIRISCPGIGLGCLTTHFIDLAVFLFGDRFVRVTGWVDPERGPNPRGAEFHDPGGLIVAQGASGTAFVFQQMEDASGPTSIVLDLTLARIVVEERESRVSVIRKDPSVKPGPGRPPKFKEEALPEDQPLKLDIVEMTAAVLSELGGGGRLTCDAENGYRSLEVVVAAYLSHLRGNIPVDLPLSHPEDLMMELAIT